VIELLSLTVSLSQRLARAHHEAQRAKDEQHLTDAEARRRSIRFVQL